MVKAKRDTIEYPDIKDVVKIISNNDILDYVNSHPEFTLIELRAYFKKKGYNIW